jgi:DNA polymerase-3 subunit delta'
LALRLAQALNCPQPVGPGEACLSCRTCRQIERMQYADLMVVQSEGAGIQLKVEQVRELLHFVSLAPYEGRYKVVLLLRIEEANDAAQNALLKTLEEPVPGVVLMLTADSTESVRPTIVSRCEVLRLRPVPLDGLAAGLQSRPGVQAGEAHLLAHISGGRPGTAIQWGQNRELLERRQMYLDDLARLLHANRLERFKYADSLTRANASKPRDKSQSRDMLVTWLSLWRDILLQASGAAAGLENPDRVGEIENLAGQVGLDGARRMVDALQHTLSLVETTNVNTRLALEVLMLDLPFC